MIRVETRGSNGADAVAPAMQAEAAGPMIEAGKLKAFVDRIERLDGEALTVGLDKRGVFDEAKKAGVNTKMLRRYLAERKRDAKDSKTDKDALDEFRALLGEPGATYRSVAAKLGMTKTKLHRLVPKHQNGTREMTADDLGEWLPPHDADGVIIDSKAGPEQDGGHARLSSDDAPQVERHEPPTTPVPDGGVGAGTNSVPGDGKSCGTRQRDRGTAEGEASPADALQQPSPTSEGCAGVAPGPQEPDWDAITASQPQQLRRVPA